MRLDSPRSSVRRQSRRIWAGLSDDAVQSLLTLGILLAPYDGAEALLKPVFGTVADRVGARPVLVAGLWGFALASALYVVVDTPGWLWAACLGQRAAALAFDGCCGANGE